VTENPEYRQGSSAKWKIRPVFFKEISGFDFLEESAFGDLCQTTAVWEGKIDRRDFSFPKQA